jgi:hypothetical protein
MFMGIKARINKMTTLLCRGWTWLHTLPPACANMYIKKWKKMGWEPRRVKKHDLL